MLINSSGDEMITLVINSVRNDIVGGSQAGQSLALAAVANIGGNEFGDALMADVSKLVRPVNRERPLYLEKAGIEYEQYLAWEILIIKKAILCLLRLFRNSPESLEMEEWSDRIHTLLGAQDLGILTSVLSLLTAFASYAPTFFEACIPTVIEILFKLAVERNISEHYKYYKIPSPWIQVKCLKFLQYYPLPEDSRIRDTLVKALESILVKTDSSDGVNKLNAENSVLFEAVHLIIAYGTDLDAALRQQALILLGNFIGFKDANTRFLGLCAMTTLVKINGAEYFSSASLCCSCLYSLYPRLCLLFVTSIFPNAFSAFHSSSLLLFDNFASFIFYITFSCLGPDDVMDHIVTVVDACKDSDVSVSKKALDLLFVMTQASNVGEVVAELVVMLSTQHESVKEEIVIKIAILAEKFALSMSWYVDTLVQVILSAGDFVSEDVSHMHPKCFGYDLFRPYRAVIIMIFCVHRFGFGSCRWLLTSQRSNSTPPLNFWLPSRVKWRTRPPSQWRDTSSASSE